MVGQIFAMVGQQFRTCLRIEMVSTDLLSCSFTILYHLLDCKMGSKRCETGCMFGRRGMDVLALCETKMKGKGEVAFGEVTSRVSGVERGRAREGVALLSSEWMGNKVVERKEVSSRLMWVRVRMGRECWSSVSAYGPGCERSEEE